MMSGFIIAMQVGMWFGYVTFGFVSDRFGRKRAYVTYLLTAAVLMLAYAVTQRPPALLLLGLSSPSSPPATSRVSAR